jgi:hypothetical protein
LRSPTEELRKKQAFPSRVRSTVSGVLAIVCLGKCGRHSLLPPNLISRSTGIGNKMPTTLVEIAVDSRLGVIDALIVAVMDDRSRHAAENRFDHVKELRSGWQGAVSTIGPPVVAAILLFSSILSNSRLEIYQDAASMRDRAYSCLCSAPEADPSCVSACNFDPLRWGIGVQN